MKLLLPAAAAIFSLALGILGASPSWADGSVYHHRHHPHVAYVEYVPDYGRCRTGWWQTVRYGHVRPKWGTWCR